MLSSTSSSTTRGGRPLAPWWLVAFVSTACAIGCSGEPEQDPANRDAGTTADAVTGTDAGDGVADASIDRPDAMPTTVRVAVVSDLNGSYGSTTYSARVHTAVDRLVAMDPDVVLSTGDMVAGQQSGLNYRAMWSGFHAAVSNPLANAGIPFAVTPGNHDASGYPLFAGERAIYVDEWQGRKPSLEFLDDSGFPLNYSFAIGQVLFVSIDDTTVGKLGAADMTWLDGEISRPGYDVKIVFGHIPLYPFSQGRETEIIGDAALETLLVDRGVDMFVSGHHHVYYPGKKGPLRLVSVACLGSGPRPLIGDSQNAPLGFLYVEIVGDHIDVLDGLTGSNLTAVVDRAGLPASIGTGPMRITRDDIAP